MRRRTRLAVLAGVLLGIALLATYAYRTARGTDGLAIMRGTLLRYLPALTIEQSAGTLEDGRIGLLAWQAKDTHIELRGIAWRLAPGCLGSITVCFETLSIDNLEIVLPPGEGEGSPLRLAAVKLPFGLRLQQGTLGALVVRKGERELTRIEAIELDAAMHGSRIDVERLRARLEQWQLRAELAGLVDLRDQLPIEAAGRIEWADRITATASAKGDLKRLQLRARGEGAYPLDAEGWIEPLEEALPLELALRTREPFAPVPEQSAWARFDAAKLVLSGTVRELAAQLEATLLSEPLGQNHVAANGVLADARFALREFVLEGERGQLKAQGAIALDAAHAWTLDAQLQDFSAPLLPADITARFTGPARLHGALAGHEPLFDASLDLVGEINQYPAALAGRVALDAARLLTLEELRLRSGPNALRLDGTAGDALDLQGSVTIEDLAATLPGAAGHGAAELRIAGTRAEPELHASVQLDKAAWSNLSADALRIEGAWIGRASAANSLRLDATMVQAGGQALDQLALELHGPAAAHTLSAHASGERIELALGCTGAIENGRDWRGGCQRIDASRGGDFAVWRLDKPVTLAWSAGEKSFAIAPFCLHERGAALCSSKRIELRDEAWSGIALRATDLPIAALRSWLPETLNPDGMLDLSLDVTRAPGAAPRIEARLSSKLVALAPEAAGEPLPLVFSDISASLHAGSGTSKLSWRALVGTDGRTSGTLELRGRDTSAPLAGTIELAAIDVGSLLRIMPGTVRAEGWVDGNIELAGSAAEPKFAGRLALRDGSFAHERLPQPIDALSLAVAFTGPDATIGGQFRSAAGHGKVEGTAHWRDTDWEARLHLTAAKLLFEPLRGSTMTLAPNLRIVLSQRHAEIRGVLQVPSAAIDLERVPPTAARVSDDTVIEGAVVAPERFAYSLNINVKLGDEVRFKGFGAEVRLGGGIRIAKQPANPLTGRGDIRIVEGRYAAYGQRLEVKDGALLFRGPLDRPDLRIDATRRIEDEPGITVGVRVRGDARLPELEVYSQPSMEESRAMSYLLTGRAPDSSGGGAGSGALAALGAAGANRLTADTMAKLGIEDFQVESRAVEGGTEVHLSGYITPELYLRYGVSTFEAVNTFRLRYRLTPKFYVEALSGVENAVDFLYSFER